MEKYLLSLAMFLIALTPFAQEDEYEINPYILGDVLVMVDHNDNIQQVVENNRKINGVMTQLELLKAASEPANIWLLHFNENNISHNEMLRALDNDAHVVMCQNNHFVTERATPNDGQFGSQWQHDNIDSELAWDITTGGQTANGDDIVVAVLEGGGSDWDHNDLIDNHWINTGEIENNGIDDDGNGYIDDYHGWNLGSGGSDNIAAGNHGTGVSGMIGATGDNNLQVVGANWDVKIMQVDMSGGLSESNVIASYTYPLVLRQMYNNSGGANGAFVVATNASWGIDYADPANYPLWCAFYDTLGYYGILNFGATANNNVDIDQVGDMPTACGSDYMISVTATNTSDQITFSAYGATTIDLGAPGASIFTTTNTNNTGSTSGTSFATPLTAGVCGLMYSVPCSDIATLALSDPQMIADSMRAALLASVDPIPGLNGLCVTGGRLNSYQSVLKIQTDCGSYNTNCTGTFSGSETATIDCNGSCNGEITMNGSGGSGSYQWSIDGGTTWQGSNVFTNLCDGAYTVMVDDGVDCQQSVAVNVTEPPSLAGSASTTHITCNGADDGSVTINAAGGTPTYTYSDDGGTTTQGSNTFSNLGPGSHTFKIVDANGCISNTINITVTQPTAMTSSFTSIDEVSGNDGSIDLTISGGSPGYSYSWTGPGGYTSNDEDPTGLAPGTYTCTITDANGCVISSGDIVIQAGAGVGINENDFDFRIYPNPASEQLTVSTAITDVTFSLIDNSGKVVQVNKLINNNSTIDVSKLAAGIYTIRLTTNDGQIAVSKLVIE